MKMKQHLQDRFVICFQSNLFMALKLCNKKNCKTLNKTKTKILKWKEVEFMIHFKKFVVSVEEKISLSC